MATKKKSKKQVWFNHGATKLAAKTVNMYKAQPTLPQPRSKK